MAAWSKQPLLEQILIVFVQLGWHEGFVPPQNAIGLYACVLPPGALPSLRIFFLQPNCRKA